MNFEQIAATYGIAGLVAIAGVYVVYLIVQSLSNRANSETKRDSTFTEISVSLNEERKASLQRERDWQERHDKLQSELTTVRIEQARKDGGLEVLEKMLNTERSERRTERDAFDEKFRKLDTRILELEKSGKQDKAHISELENRNAQLTLDLQAANDAIGALEVRNAELQTTATYERNRADTLSALVEKIRTIDTTKGVTGNTQTIPDMRDVDDTFITEPTAADVITPGIVPQTENNSTSAAPVAAEETQK